MTWRAFLAGLLACPMALAAPDGLDDLTVAPEHRCSPYDRRRDYSYPAIIEAMIVKRAGHVVDTRGHIDPPFPSPYLAGVTFRSIRETDIEHIVAAAEAHDSGLCAMPVSVRREFARDLDNLTIASPTLNRRWKSDKDAAEWMPEINRCWFAQTAVNVKAKYGLTVDEAEYRALAGECP